MRLKGKVAIVTGAGSGNGAAIAMAYLKEGAFVTLADINEASLHETMRDKDIEANKYLLQYMDVTDRSSVKKCIESTIDKFGKLDIMVANAGLTVRKDFLEQTDEDLEKVLAVNVKGVFICAQEAAREMVKSGGGSIINMSSISSIIAPQKGIVPYGASKGAVLSMTRHMAYDLSGRNVRVNAIAPGTILTKINEERLSKPGEMEREASKMMLGRIGNTEDIVGAAIFLATEESSFMTGTQIVVDGGETAR